MMDIGKTRIYSAIHWLGVETFEERTDRLFRMTGFIGSATPLDAPRMTLVTGEVVVNLPEGWTFDFEEPVKHNGRLCGAGIPGVGEIHSLYAFDPKGRKRVMFRETSQEKLLVLTDILPFKYYTHIYEHTSYDWVVQNGLGEVVHRIVDGQRARDQGSVERQAEVWLDANHPRWRDASAYWDDVI